MNNSEYITSSKSVSKPSKKVGFKGFAVISFCILFLSMGFFSVTSQKKQDQADAGIADWIICSIVGGEAAEAWQFFMTDDWKFYLSSKSAFGHPADDVDDYWLNKMIQTGDDGFGDTNELILGRSLDPAELSEAEDSETAFNAGLKVNPFDRFGLAGLYFTGYLGEWHYLEVKLCEGGEAKETGYNKFYPGRLIPRTPWTARGNSADIRSKEHVKPYSTNFTNAFLNTIANWTFNISKLTIAITIALLNYAFGDPVESLGLNKVIFGSDVSGGGGMFTQLFDNIFMTLIGIVFVLTGMSILWKGIVKRQYRNAMNVLFRSIAMYIFAFIIAFNPQFWIGLPNAAAVFGQTILISAMSGSIAGGGGLCETDVGIADVEIVDDRPDENTVESQVSYLEGIGINVRSIIGCTMWQQFLLKPWSEGQFGADWNKTWAEGEIPSWAPSGAESIGNSELNQGMVGSADVPLGDDTFLHNWAVLQISVQTNAHSPIDGDGQLSTYTGDIANDWWRIADAMANYTEREISISDQGAEETAASSEFSEVIKIPNDTVEPVSMWSDWIGGHMSSRILTAFSAVFVTIIGIMAPLFFGFLTAIYAIGIAILMLFAPIMLLLACWADRGWEIFKSWVELVINLVIKRIGMGFMLVMSLIITGMVLNLMETVGWWTGILLMILLSAILIKNRTKLIDAVASVSFAKHSFGGTAGRFGGKVKSMTVGSAAATGRMGAGMAVGGARGGMASKRGGGSALAGLRKGAFAGARQEFKNLSYKNRTIREGVITHDGLQQWGPDNRSNSMISKQKNCLYCSEFLDQYNSVFRDADGNYLCYQCGSDLNEDDLREIQIKGNNAMLDWEATESSNEKYDDYNNDGASYYSEEENKEKITKIEAHAVSENPPDNEEIMGKVLNLSTVIEDDIKKAESRPRSIDDENIPPVPEHLQNYLDIGLLDQAWVNGQHDVIREMYLHATLQWAVELFGGEFAEFVKDDLDKHLNQGRLDMNDRKAALYSGGQYEVDDEE